MPRLTRAAARANLAFYEEAASIPLPETPKKARRPLGEVTGNTPPKFRESEPKEAVQSTISKGIRTKPAAEGVVLWNHTNSSQTIRPCIIIEENGLGAINSAVSEVCESLRTDNRDGPSLALADTRRRSLPASKPERRGSFSPRDLQERRSNPYTGASRESLVEAGSTPQAPCVKCPVPQISLTSPLVDSNVLMDIVSLESALSNTPHVLVDERNMIASKRSISRIEDSVGAIDTTQDELERIRQVIPADRPEATVQKQLKQKDQSKKNEISGDDATTCQQSDDHSTSKWKYSRSSTVARSKQKPNNSAVAIKLSNASTSSRPDPCKSQKLVSLQGASLSKTAPVGSKPAARVSSLEKPPFQPAKSTRPLTRPSFVLPGDAIAQKLREKRQERLSLREDLVASQKPPQLTKPYHPHLVKMNASTRARLNLAEGKSSSKLQTPIVMQQPAVSKRVIGCKDSSDVTMERSQASKTQISLGSHRSKAASLAASPKHPSALEQAVHEESRIVSSSRPPTKGKIVFDRPKRLQEEKDVERKKKQEASKEARIQAAERGRIASREWAEKQKAKKSSTLMAES